ncbi:MAG: protein kinase [Candidatus Eisenbacteria bacterium]|nr:protein kinase [Candidatus Eisenbacteria bacterium]
MTPEKIGPYPIERELGRGGMGVVYLGRDTRLDRRVAIKVLPDAFAVDPERLARFEREARMVASLNHPNIAGIYGIEESDGHRFLALEYVDGDTLAERIGRGPLSLDDTLDVCRQVAAALEAAHEGGVVHRDLKPANIKVTTAGEVKVLDFGLAKSGAAVGVDSAPDLSNSPTLTRGMTAAGMILGTAAYMSPEQARGKPVDKRTDIWAFGCLLYECLTGRQAFAGETVSDMIARILQGEPEWNALPARTPERIRGLLRRCLEKDAKRRLRDIGDARMEIEDVLAVHASSSSMAAAGAAGVAATGSRRLVEWGRLAGVAVLAAGLAYFVPQAVQRPASSQRLRFTVPQPEGVFLSTDGVSATLSPDGRTLAFVAFDSTRDAHIWLRDMESTVARRLARTDQAGFPFFWSPDSRQIAFSVQEKLKKIAVTGGNAETVCPIKALRGGSWNQDGVMIVAPYANGAIYRVAAGGGELKPVTTVDTTRSETAHRFPQFLPDGKHFLFTALPAHDGKFDTYVGSLDSPKRQLLLSAATGVTWASPGHLLYARDDKLIAQGFDAGTLKLRGEPVSLGDDVTSTEFSGGPIASASMTGCVAYGTSQLTSQRLAWVDYDGKELARIPLAPGPYFGGSLSPDDRRVALRRSESAALSDIWIADLERGVATRFTDEPGSNDTPRWSPDGTRIAYVWGNPQRIKVKSLGGEAVTTFLDSDPLFKVLFGWTPDGQNLVYARLDPVTQWDLWILPMNGNNEPRPYLKTRFNELAASVSPDGRWMAYNSNESGQFEAYVQSFPVPGGKYQVTNEGGTNFGWSRDGRQLHYGLNSDPGIRYAADVLEGSEFRLGPPRREITAPKDVRGMTRAYTGRRILALLPAGNDPTRSLTVMLNGLPGSRKQ